MKKDKEQKQAPAIDSAAEAEKGNSKTVTKQRAVPIIINPPDKQTIDEESDKTAVMAFGRYNPPTIGHEKLINKVKQVATEHGGSAHIVASHSENTSKDPLPQDKKIGYIKKVAGEDVHVSGSSKEHPTLFHAASKLYSQGHKHLVLVAGSDRVNEYKDKFEKYNGTTGKHGHFNFDSIKIVSAGKRDPDSEGAEGISGTKMREFARTGQHDKFKAGLPKAIQSHAKEMTKHISSISESTMNIDEFEELIVERVLTLQQRRKRALNMRRLEPLMVRRRKMLSKIMAGQKQLTRRATKAAKNILRARFAGRRGASYQKLGPSDKISVDKLIEPKVKLVKNIAARLMPRIKQAETKRYTNKMLGKSTRNIKISGPLVQHYEYDRLVTVLSDISKHDDVELQEGMFKSLEQKAQKIDMPYIEMLEMYSRELNNVPTEKHTRVQIAFDAINSHVANLTEQKMKNDPCWKGYKMVGTKQKNNKEVPNCVPESVDEASYYSVSPEELQKHRKAWQSGEISRSEYIKKVGLSVKKTPGSREITDPSDQPSAKTTVTMHNKTSSLASHRPTGSMSKLKDYLTRVGAKPATEETVSEKLDMDRVSVGDVVTDFQKSDAPQFAGKSKEKKRQMAIAAYLSNKKK